MALVGGRRHLDSGLALSRFRAAYDVWTSIRNYMSSSRVDGQLDRLMHVGELVCVDSAWSYVYDGIKVFAIWDSNWPYAWASLCLASDLVERKVVDKLALNGLTWTLVRSSEHPTTVWDGVMPTRSMQYAWWKWLDARDSRAYYEDGRRIGRHE